MKKLIRILMLLASGTVSYAQDTVYISREKTTALFFNSAVRITGVTPGDVAVAQKESGLITVRAERTGIRPTLLKVQQVGTANIYNITLAYSYGRAGRRVEIGQMPAPVVTGLKSPGYNYPAIAGELAAGKRKDVIDHAKTGGVKAWVDKLSLAGNEVFFRLDLRNQSSLPYDVDFIRFYIRDLKTVARMATHEQEIVPLYSSLPKKTTIVHKGQIAGVFAFHRFSLSEEQALSVEIYERNGNRHICLQIKQKDLDHIHTIDPASQQPVNAIAATTTN